MLSLFEKGAKGRLGIGDDALVALGLAESDEVDLVLDVALDALDVGEPFTVTRIPEELEFTPGLLEFLESSSLQPGMSGTITASSPDGTPTPRR